MPRNENYSITIWGNSVDARRLPKDNLNYMLDCLEQLVKNEEILSGCRSIELMKEVSRMSIPDIEENEDFDGMAFDSLKSIFRQILVANLGMKEFNHFCKKLGIT